eukprot:TRINITY_DN1912_c0_g1_i1.p2 TRINITY_DN1912_c0_g1~~TRINITY_DN1912_c0_g1_i1.p2  ORF type:complete len:520 (+),score=206.43 TRINITY_DN1912_c0_g1_i1:140-1699(+)
MGVDVEADSRFLRGAGAARVPTPLTFTASGSKPCLLSSPQQPTSPRGGVANGIAVRTPSGIRKIGSTPDFGLGRRTESTRSQSPATPTDAFPSPRLDRQGLDPADCDAFDYLMALLPIGVFGVDIGGTVGKCVFLYDKKAGTDDVKESLLAKGRFGETGERVTELDFDAPSMNGRVHFVKWETHRVQTFCNRVQDERARILQCTPPDDQQSPPTSPTNAPQRHDIYATGGGAFKFQDALHSTFGVKYHKVPEFDSLVLGLRYLLESHPESMYTIRNKVVAPAAFSPSQYPIAVCNIGSGVSVLKILADGTFERLGGTSIGGSTFYGLCKLMLGSRRTFEECLALAHEGNPAEVDITVGDIYGETGASLLDLPIAAPASSFGKLVSMSDEDVDRVDPAAVAASVLAMTTQAIQQIATGLAKKGGCGAVFFTGGFLRGNELSQTKLCEFARLAGEEAYFLRHAEYAGALGCLVKAYDKKKARERRRLNRKASAFANIPKVRSVTGLDNARAVQADIDIDDL